MTTCISDDLRKIEIFLQDNNIDLNYTDADENYIDIAGDRIVVSSSQTPTQLVYTLLHEIGHYFSDFHSSLDTKVTIIIEEVLAWDTGRDIAYSLGIDIDEQQWSDLMISCIGEYIEK